MLVTMAVLPRKKSTLFYIMLSLSFNRSTAAFGKCFVGGARRSFAERRRRLAAPSRRCMSSSPAEEYDAQICNHALVGEREQVQDPTKPFFPIYYNDVYEVTLPENHRFPMDKYRQVRRLAQTWIASQTEKEQSQVVCGA